MQSSSSHPLKAFPQASPGTPDLQRGLTSLFLSQIDKSSQINSVVAAFLDIQRRRAEMGTHLDQTMLCLRAFIEETKGNQKLYAPTPRSSELSKMLFDVSRLNLGLGQSEQQVLERFLEFSGHTKRATLSHLRFYESRFKSLTRENEALKQRVRMLSGLAELSVDGTLLLHYQEKIMFLEEVVGQKERVIGGLKERERWRKWVARVTRGAPEEFWGTLGKVQPTSDPNSRARIGLGAVSAQPHNQGIDKIQTSIQDLETDLRVVREEIGELERRRTRLLELTDPPAEFKDDLVQIQQENQLFSHSLKEIDRQITRNAAEIIKIWPVSTKKPVPNALMCSDNNLAPGFRQVQSQEHLATEQQGTPWGLWRELLALRSSVAKLMAQLSWGRSKNALEKKYPHLRLDPSRFINRKRSQAEEAPAKGTPPDLHKALEALLENSEEIKKANALISYAMDENRELTSKNRTQTLRLIEQDRDLEAERAQLLQLSQEIAGLKIQAEVTQVELAQKKTLIKKKEEKISRLKQAKNDLEAEIRDLNQKIAENDARIKELLDRIQVLNNENAALQDHIISQNASMLRLIEEDAAIRLRLAQTLEKGEALRKLVEVLGEKSGHMDIELKRLRHQLMENELARKELLYALERQTANQTVQEKIWETIKGRGGLERGGAASSLTDLSHRASQLQADELKIKLKESLRQLHQERMKADELRKKLTKAETIDKVILQQSVKKLKKELVSGKERTSEKGKSITNTTDAFSPTQHDSDMKRSDPSAFSVQESLREIHFKKWMTEYNHQGPKRSDNFQKK